MQASDVVALYRELERCGVRVWIDGGWAVDALLGKQTREHTDLDIAIEAKDVPALRDITAALGYQDLVEETSWNFVLTASNARKLDVHAFVFDAAGDGVLGPAELGHKYPNGSLEGVGAIAGYEVRCIALEYLIRFKTSYEPRPVDSADIAALTALKAEGQAS